MNKFGKMNVAYVHTLERPAAFSDRGNLRVNVVDSVSRQPVDNATVSIAYTGEPQNLIEQVRTDSDGQTELIALPAPPVEYSMNPEGITQPYSEYTVTVRVQGFEPFSVSGSEIFSGETSLQEIPLNVTGTGVGADNIVIPANTLFGNYPSKIPEDEVQPVNQPGEIVLSRVVVPETVIVHDGAPTDSTAQNYYVRYRDYIKNVACSEIYSTWPQAAIEANVLAILSFTMNRVYTEFYRDI